eukprot:TRINITY_DN9157_c0_g1_i4.p1 TRINITY_DN9157_c0_g1~~TRINITY_DN9157_c0_g1_i4.p1  ORF type:complete len:251 (+),score=10.99 TRINITY_DN9157_c0_g1_i4:34-786(+)
MGLYLCTEACLPVYRQTAVMRLIFMIAAYRFATLANENALEQQKLAGMYQNRILALKAQTGCETIDGTDRLCLPVKWHEQDRLIFMRPRKVGSTSLTDFISHSMNMCANECAPNSGTCSGCVYTYNCSRCQLHPAIRHCHPCPHDSLVALKQRFGAMATKYRYLGHPAGRWYGVTVIRDPFTRLVDKDEQMNANSFQGILLCSRICIVCQLCAQCLSTQTRRQRNGRRPGENIANPLAHENVRRGKGCHM